MSLNVGQIIDSSIPLTPNNAFLPPITPRMLQTNDNPFACPTPGHASLICHNDGLCRVGESSLDIYAGLDAATSEWLNDYMGNMDTSMDGGMYCQCPHGYVGQYCDTKIVVCGEGEHLCLSGGACVVDGLDEEREHYTCECNRYEDKPTEAGKMCEFVATASCDLNDKYSDHAFCTNGGTCVDFVDSMGGHIGCNCPDGFIGKHCEIVEGLMFDPDRPPPPPPVTETTQTVTTDTDAEPENTNTAPVDTFGGECPTPGFHRLMCHHGGKCRAGERPPDLYAGLDAVTTEWLNKELKNTDTSGDGGMYCECPNGYTGPYCGTKVVVCGEGEHLCLGGGACVFNEITDEKEAFYTCQCNRYSDKPTEAGKMCEMIATSSCELDKEYSEHAYCTNGGSCYNFVDSNNLMDHIGCTCPEGFKGKHCEIVEGLQFDTPDVETPGGTTSIFIPPKNEETTSAPEENDSADSETPVMVDEEPITPDFDDDNTDSSQNGWVKYDSESTKKEQKAVHIVGLSFAILALVLFPVFLLVMRRTLRREKQNLAQRTPTDLNLEPDGGTMPAAKSDDSTADNSASTGMEGESVQGSENATIV